MVRVALKSLSLSLSLPAIRPYASPLQLSAELYRAHVRFSTGGALSIWLSIVQRSICSSQNALRGAEFG